MFVLASQPRECALGACFILGAFRGLGVKAPHFAFLKQNQYENKQNNFKTSKNSGK